MWGAKTPRIIQNTFPEITWKKNEKNKNIYLTFDDGPCLYSTDWILNLLSKKNIQSTFFCIGENAKANPKIIDSIIQSGHIIGNHTYSHTNGALTSTQNYIQDIKRCEDVIPYTNLFRPPFGKIYPWQIKRIKTRYKIIMWDIMSYDFNPSISKKKLQNNVIQNVEKGSIIVFHDNKLAIENLKKNLVEILENLSDSGYKFKLFRSNTKEV